MSVRDQIIQIIQNEIPYPVPVTEETHLYRDLHLDSLSYVSLLMDVEEHFGIVIPLPEMEHCLSVGQMIRLTETLTKENLS